MAPTSGWTFEVFLSFHGEDTRKTFVSHLYDKLITKGIYTFKDDQKLPRGKFISQELRETIRDSRISVVVLSENYASSTWCLEELSEIMVCKEKKGQIVIPVFFKVDPSDVRKVRKGFEKAIAEHEKNFREEREKVQRWRAALTKVASVSGWHLKDSEEATFIGKIAADILDKVSCASSVDASEFVGMGSHVEALKQLLSIELSVVRMVGIWGKHGVGKTAIARIVYEKLHKNFGACCFLEDVGCKFKNHGATYVKEELLSKLLNEKDLTGWPLDGYSSVIKDRLCQKKVLIVLDNVDNQEQLKELARSADWFGRGSRILITTRDKRLLDAHGVKLVYETKTMENDAALQLFSRCAFNKNQPENEYLEMSCDFVTYAEGLPLALMVLGLSLCNKSLEQWRHELDKLTSTPNQQLSHRLQISYDGLEETEKQVFLDIACFFCGEDKNKVRDILHACGFYPDSAFDALANKALLTISNNKLFIDELLREMAALIVQQECNDPGKHSRLWDPKHINHVLLTCMGTEKVEGIFLEMSKLKPMNLSPRTFNKMFSLRLLKFHYFQAFQRTCNKQILDGGLEYLSGQLRYLHWDAYPSSSLVPSFSPANLVELSLRHSNIKQLWTGKETLSNLKVIDLSHSMLVQLPDLSEAQNLRSLNLRSCTNLVKVLSIQYLTKLEYLNLSDCTKLQKLSELPRSIKYLYLAGTDLEELPESLGFSSDLVMLDIRNCARLKKLPNSIIRLKSLESLDISGCTILLELLSIIGSPRISSIDLSNCISRLGDCNICCKLSSERNVGKEAVEEPAAPLEHFGQRSLGQQNSEERSFDKSDCDDICLENGGGMILDIEAKYSSEWDFQDKTGTPEDRTETSFATSPHKTKALHSGDFLSQEQEIHTEISPTIVKTFAATKFQISTPTDIISSCLVTSDTCTSMLHLVPNGMQKSRLTSDIELPTLALNSGLSKAKARKELVAHLHMPLEAIHQADAFKIIEKIASTLLQHASQLYDKTSLNWLICRVKELKHSVPDTLYKIKTAQAKKLALPKKARELYASLGKRRAQFNILQSELSDLSKEEDELEDEIRRLKEKKREVSGRKRFVTNQMHAVDAECSKNLEACKNVDAEMEQVESILLEGKDRLAQDNASWKLLREHLAMGSL